MNNQDQNLLKETPVERIIHPPGFYRSLVLDALTVSGAFLLGLGLNAYLAGKWTLWVLVLSMLPIAACTAIRIILPRSLGLDLIVLALSATAVAVPFTDRAGVNLPGVFVIIAGTFAWGWFLGRGVADGGLRLRFLSAARVAIAKMITGLILAAILILWPQYSTSGTLVSENVFRGFYGWVSEAASTFYQEIRFNSDVGTLIQDLAEYSLEANNTMSYRQLPPEIQNEILTKATEQLTDRTREFLRDDLDPRETVNQAAYRMTSGVLQVLKQSIGGWFFVGWALAVFFVMRAVGILATWFLVLAAYLIYQALLGLNIISLSGEGATREVARWR